MPKVLSRWARVAARVAQPYSRVQGHAKKALTVIVMLGAFAGIGSLALWQKTAHAWLAAGPHQALAGAIVFLGFALWALYGVEKEADALAAKFSVKMKDTSDDPRFKDGAMAVLRRQLRDKKPDVWDDYLDLDLWIVITNFADYETSVSFPAIGIFSRARAKRGKKEWKALEIVPWSLYGLWGAEKKEDIHWDRDKVKRIRAREPIEASVTLVGQCPAGIYELASCELEVRIAVEIVGQKMPCECRVAIAPRFLLEL